MRLAFGILSVLVCLTVATSTAAAAAKQPWEWTPEERAQARRDPAKRIERLQAEDGKRRMAHVSSASLPRVADVIDGRIHPELFFATELFEYLVRSAFVTLPGVYPQVVRHGPSDLLYKTADWDRFSAIVANYAEVLREEHSAANALDKEAVSAIQRRKHMAEARALRYARGAFGVAGFDRMLYENVAVGMTTSFSMDTDFETSIGTALAREERAQ